MSVYFMKINWKLSGGKSYGLGISRASLLITLFSVSHPVLKAS